MPHKKTPIEMIFIEEFKREPTPRERRALLERPKMEKKSGNARETKKRTSRRG